MTALDAKTGTVLWKTPTGQTIASGPSIRGNQLFFGNNNGVIHALDASTGQIQWTIKTKGLVTTAPVVGKDMLFVTGLDSQVYAIR